MSMTVKPKYKLNDDGCFVLSEYNHAKPFSNFFPGVAGAWGVPMWVFYVNRGQCISSFGIESKDKAMLEFLPANKAYRATSLQGFRTFVKVSSGKKIFEWEPFDSVSGRAFRVSQNMRMTSHDLTIEEVNHTLGLVCRVNYFTLPEEGFPALIRRVTFENISKKELNLEVIDGLPMFLPYGMNDWVVKNMTRTVEAWIKVRNVENRAPYYHLNVEVSDTPDVRHIKEGNFYFAFQDGKKTLLPAIVEMECVFGQRTGFVVPHGFFGKSKFSVPKLQQTSNRTPSAMSFAKMNLPLNASKTVTSVMGHAHSQKQLMKVVAKVTTKNYIDKKAVRNRDIITGIKHYAFTNSALPLFDQYATQTFLDNVLRGGLPVSLPTKEGPVAFNVFSRKHGDLERDYNYFTLAPTYFSQGNGNFRDVNQNRRNDVWFNTDVADSSITTFFNLSQADGYNPLVVKGMSFFALNRKILKKIFKETISGDYDALDILIEEGFQPGQLLNIIENKGIKLKVAPQEFLEKVLSVCRKQTLADHSEGFWVDHWTYNIDLLESYLAIFPDKLRKLLIEKKMFSFFFNDHYVLPRDQRYILTDKGVRQYHSVMDGSKSIFAKEAGHLLRSDNGQGDVYHTDLAVKILCLIANKVATLDPDGIGVEMEADRPGWYDALNGLPGLLGSSICETFEIQRYARFLLDALDELAIDDHYELRIFDELGDFIKNLIVILSSEKDALAYWCQANEAKENYRLSVRKGIKGDEEGLSIGNVREFLMLVIEKTQKGIERAKDEKGLFPTYFAYEVIRHETLEYKHEGQSFVMPLAFRRRSLPLFLEGFVHALRVERDPQKARKIYQAVRSSALFDKKLKMYKVNADLTSESEDIGRTRVFPRGWLENESVWLHMEYKYLLELLRSGLYKEFYQTMRDILVPFFKPEVYGRSILENSSFLVSSAHEDPALYGQGFVARLSGSTAEFVHIWLWMNVGQNPFLMNQQDELCLHFEPILAKELFTEKSEVIFHVNHYGEWEEVMFPKSTYAFHFLGSVLVVYHNPNNLDIFPDSDYQIERILLTYGGEKKPMCLTDGFVPAPYAQDIRDGKVGRIDVHFI